MSDEQNKDGSAASQPNVSEEPKDEVVSKKAYEEVTRDMHKNKQKAKELEMALNEVKAQLKANEEAKMQENEQYKELLERRTAELEEVKRQTKEKDEKFNRSVKLAALKQELGGKVKDAYLSFANVDGISMNEDGTIDSESLRNVANGFRKEHGELIPNSDSSNFTGHAPSSSNDIVTKPDITKMSSAELVKRYEELKSKQ